MGRILTAVSSAGSEPATVSSFCASSKARLTLHPARMPSKGGVTSSPLCLPFARPPPSQTGHSAGSVRTS
eukprot:scaffold276_cov548-Prasinococcus_capsulatus_cf.AAC.13